MTNDKFWFVWSPQFRVGTKYFYTRNEAIASAKAWACKSPKDEFYVMEAMDMLFVPSPSPQHTVLQPRPEVQR